MIGGLIGVQFQLHFEPRNHYLSETIRYKIFALYMNIYESILQNVSYGRALNYVSYVTLDPPNNCINLIK